MTIPGGQNTQLQSFKIIFFFQLTHSVSTNYIATIFLHTRNHFFIHLLSFTDKGNGKLWSLCLIQMSLTAVFIRFSDNLTADKIATVTKIKLRNPLKVLKNRTLIDKKQKKNKDPNVFITSIFHAKCHDS